MSKILVRQTLKARIKYTNPDLYVLKHKNGEVQTITLKNKDNHLYYEKDNKVIDTEQEKEQESNIDQNGTVKNLTTKRAKELDLLSFRERRLKELEASLKKNERLIANELKKQSKLKSKLAIEKSKQRIELIKQDSQNQKDAFYSTFKQRRHLTPKQVLEIKKKELKQGLKSIQNNFNINSSNLKEIANTFIKNKVKLTKQNTVELIKRNKEALNKLLTNPKQFFKDILSNKFNPFQRAKKFLDLVKKFNESKLVNFTVRSDVAVDATADAVATSETFDVLDLIELLII